MSFKLVRRNNPEFVLRQDHERVKAKNAELREAIQDIKEEMTMKKKELDLFKAKIAEQRAYIERLEWALRIVSKRTEHPAPAPFFRDYTGQWWQLTSFSYEQLMGNWAEIQRVVKEALAEP